MSAELMWGLGWAGLGWGVTVLILRRCCNPDSFLFVVDHPNARSLHVAPTPRSGGVGIMGGILVGAGGLGTQDLLYGPLGIVVAGAVALSALGMVDDRKNLPVAGRLAIQLLVAAASLLALTDDRASLYCWSGALGFLVTLAWICWMTNLFNFMDGADGLAGGMTVLGFGCLAISALLAGQIALTILCATIGLAGLAFLIFNFPPARIFMGDGGSIPLGFLAAAVGLVGSQQGAWAAWYPVLVFAPFVLDATWTLVRRMIKGERFWRPHREHHYQRMVRMGISRRGMVLCWYGVMAGGGGVAIGIRSASADWQLGAAGIWLALLSFAGLWVDRRWASQESHVRAKS